MSAPHETDRARPPRLAARWLARALGPGATSDSILGDLWEEYLSRRGHGAWRAALWYWAAAIPLGLERGSRRAGSAAIRLFVDVGKGGAGMMRDLGHALGTLAKRPLFTGFAVLSVAIGIGAATATSSVMDALFLRPQPGVSGPEAMVHVMRRSTGRMGTFSHPDVQSLRSGLGSLSGLAAAQSDDVNVGSEDGGFQVWGMYVSARYFDIVGAAPSRGRFFLEGEDIGLGEHPVAVVSDRFWREHLQGDPDAVDGTLRLDGERVRVVGVAPPGFTGHLRGISAEIWLPLTQFPPLRRNPEVLEDRREPLFNVVGRLGPGRTRAQAQAEADALAASLEERFPEAYENVGAAVRIVPYSPFPGGTGARPMVMVAVALAALVGLVLLITVTNVAGLLLARAPARRREVAVRMALGASRARLTSYLIAETLVLFVLGGLGGVALAWAVTRALDLGALPIRVPVRLDFSPDVRVMAAGFALALVAGLLFGVGPALRATRSGVFPVIGDRPEVPERARLRGLFVLAQVAMSLVLVSAGLTFVRSARHAGAVPRGFETSDRFTVTTDVGVAWNGTADEAGRRAGEIVERLGSSPAFRSVALSSDLPLDLNGGSRPHFREGSDPRGRPDPGVYRNVVSVGYFRTLGIPVMAGRTFDEGDRRGGRRVAIVNRAYAERFGAGGSVLGRRFHTGTPDQPIEIVGVVEDVPDGALRTLGSAMVYLPLAQRPQRELEVTVWARSGGSATSATLVRLLREANPDLSLGPVRTLEEVARLATFDQRAGMAVTSALAAVGLLLSGLGLYGVVAFRVSSRRREIGVRMALGARPDAVARQVLRGGLALAIPGVLLGSLAAVVLARGLGFLLYGVQPADPVIIGGVAAAGLLTVALATWGPARRAAATDPGVTLRAR